MENTDPQDTSSNANEPSAPQLTTLELRVLGSIMEKELTTPNGYPLTVNSIQSACNQKSSREPVSNHQLGDLKRTLQQLDEKKFVTQEFGSRAEKYSQRFMKFLELGKKQQAILCVMMLRGPQTISELDTRTQRMCEFTNRDDLEYCIDRLCNREIPFAIRLGHQPGQRGERIGHLFSGMPTVSTMQAPAASRTAVRSSATEKNETVELLEIEVADLKSIVHTLQAETKELKEQLESLYILTDNEIESGSGDPS